MNNKIENKILTIAQLGNLELLGTASITADGKSYYQSAKLDNSESVAIYWDIIADDDEADNCCDWNSPASVTKSGRLIWDWQRTVE